MDILIIGGTRFFGIPMVKRLIARGHDVTIATRGMHGDTFGDAVNRITLDRTDAESVRSALAGKYYDVVIDKVAYSSNDVRAFAESAAFGRYIQMSSCAVYREGHLLVKEEEFDPASHPFVWTGRDEDYSECKRRAEAAAVSLFGQEKCTFVRYPVVMGANDYTGRLAFYAEHVCRGLPMHIGNADAGVSYINEDDAGCFIAHLAEYPVSGAVNGCSRGIVSQREIVSRIERIAGKTAVFSETGDPAPYNGTACDTSYDCTKAESTGYVFTELESWLYPLIDQIINTYQGGK